MLVQKQFPFKKNLVQRNIWPKNSGPKNVCQKIFAQENVGSKKCWPKKFKLRRKCV